MNFEDLQHGVIPRRSSTQTPSQAVAAGIFQINTVVASFRRLVDSIGASKDTPELRQKLHYARQKIGKLVKETSAKLKALSLEDQSDGVNPNKKIEDAKLARDFQATLQAYQRIQQLAAERESTYAPSGSSSSSGSQTLPTSSGLNEHTNLDADEESQLLIRKQKREEVVLLGNEIAFNEAIIDEREQGIRDIEEEIVQSNEIFRDLAVLVHGQGVMIDDIASNLDSSAVVSTQAKIQLSKAHKSVKSRSSWRWWLLILLVVVILVVIVVLNL